MFTLEDCIHRSSGSYCRTPAFRPKTVYSYVIEFADSESDLGLCNLSLFVELLAFLRIRMTITIENYSPTIRRNTVLIFYKTIFMP